MRPILQEQPAPHSLFALPEGRDRQFRFTKRSGTRFVNASALCVAAAGERYSHAVDTRVTLVLGGARSGKSRYAEDLIAAFPPPWTYIATADAFDAEMTERIAEHKKRRGDSWRTVDAPRDLPDAIRANRPAMPILADCLTLWLSNLMLAEQDIEAETNKLDDALAARRAPTILVANEVGFGIVPENALARRFRDLHGRLNQRVAARADRVVLVVAGIPLVIKGAP